MILREKLFLLSTAKEEEEEVIVGRGKRVHCNRNFYRQSIEFFILGVYRRCCMCITGSFKRGHYSSLHKWCMWRLNIHAGDDH